MANINLSSKLRQECNRWR